MSRVRFTRGHVMDAAIMASATAGGLGHAAFTGLRHGHRWARRVLGWAFAVVLLTEITTTVLVFSRGLPLPGAGGDAGRHGIGWQPLAVGLVAWAVGLMIARRTGAPDTAAPERVDAAID